VPPISNEDVEVEEVDAELEVVEESRPLGELGGGMAHSGDAHVFDGRVEMKVGGLGDGFGDGFGGGGLELGEVEVEPEVFGREGLEGGAAGPAQLGKRDGGVEAFLDAGGFGVHVGGENGLATVKAAGDEGVAPEVVARGGS